MNDEGNMQEPEPPRGDEGERTLGELPVYADGESAVHRMSMEKAEMIAERVFSEHAELFRRLAQ